ncbi:glycosyltransferase [Pseudomaricurvus sp. HS19]|uniref:glycosyltransferase n=1 Tax=Pseudomaricurvus sp. HS19 TaxID=2692626 RepID=UPI001368C598|nr:glycosyltransferase [Pseudomaricurvus sp. HS19]MYM62055.1 glycosyltransferase [Pseudomaricurvus sp. HS19]
MEIAVLLPCYNEGLSIRKVVSDFRSVLPQATIYVYDNCSTDNTIAEARAAGAVVRQERWQGKGNVVRRMFTDVEADIYLMADGDGTYDFSVAPEMIAKLTQSGADMVVGTRKNVYANAHRRGHGFGNQLFNRVYRSLFGPLFTDIFSGYRVFSRRYVKSFPAISSGFEIETEMSVHASQLRIPVEEMPTEYGARQEGSSSKLRTVRDALRIFFTFLILFKEIRPARFFGVIAIILTALAVLIALPLVFTYLDTGLVPRFPTAILATGMVLLAGIFMVSGLILDSVARGRLEQKRIWYMSIPATAIKEDAPRCLSVSS